MRKEVKDKLDAVLASAKARPCDVRGEAPAATPAAPVQPEAPEAPEPEDVFSKLRSAVGSLLPEGASIVDGVCYQNGGADMVFQRCTNKEGALSLEGDPMKIEKQTSAAPASPAAPEASPNPSLQGQAQTDVIQALAQTTATLEAIRAENAALAAKLAKIEQDERNREMEQACAKAGMLAGLVPVLMSQVVRGEGQTADEAVAAFRQTCPAAFGAVAAPTAEGAVSHPARGLAGLQMPSTPAPQSAQAAGVAKNNKSAWQLEQERNLASFAARQAR